MPPKEQSSTNLKLKPQKKQAKKRKVEPKTSRHVTGTTSNGTSAIENPSSEDQDTDLDTDQDMDTDDSPLAVAISTTNIGKQSAISQSALQTLAKSANLVQSSINMMAELINDYREACKDLPPQEKREAINSIVNTEMYTSFAKASAETATAMTLCLNMQAQAQVQARVTEPESNNSRVNTPKVHIQFELKLIPKDKSSKVSEKVLDTFMNATEKTPLNITRQEDRDGTGIIRLSRQHHVTAATKALQRYKIQDVPATDYYTITSTPSSPFVIRLIKATKESLVTNVNWINSDMQVNLKLASTELHMKNVDWCHTPEDIEHICLNRIPNDEYVLLIYISERAHDALIMTGSSAQMVNCGNNIIMKGYVNVSPEICFKCCQFGHSFKDCANSTRCKFCGDDHPSSACQQPTNPTCFRCSALKNIDPLNKQHNALDNKCPEVKRQRDLAFASKRESLINKYNGSSQ